jgi:hypothetical protein
MFLENMKEFFKQHPSASKVLQFAGVGLFIYLAYFFSTIGLDERRCEWYFARKNDSFYGVVVEKYKQKMWNMKIHTPNTHKQKDSWVSTWKPAYDSTDIGDTIVKKRGELTFTIRKPARTIIAEFESYSPECEPDTILQRKSP